MALYDSYGNLATGYTATATLSQTLNTSTWALSTGVWPSWWLGGAGTNGTPGGTAEASARSIAGTSTVPMSVSWGDRAEFGWPIDKIVKPIGADGFGAEILMLSAGEPLFKDRENNLQKIYANGTLVYDITQGGIIHDAVADVVWYDGTSDAQIQDPTFVAAYGSQVVPGYVGQMVCKIEYNTYKPWNGERPGHTLIIQDATPGTVGTFEAWGGTLDIANKSTEITLTNGDLTAERTSQAVFGEWAAAMGTEGKEPEDDGWYVYEYKNDVLSGLAPWWGGPGITTGDHAVQTEWGGDSHSIYFAHDGWYYWNETGTGAITPAMPVGAWVMVVFRKDLLKVWKGTDATGWQPGGDPILGTGGIDISHMAGETVYPLWSTRFSTQKGTFNFSGPFVNTPPGGELGEEIPGAPVNWGEVFVELGVLSNLERTYIDVTTVTAESEGGSVRGGFGWAEAVRNSGLLENIDFVEDGRYIRVVQTDLEDPTPAIDEIPSHHRYIISEDKGSTEAVRGGQRRKPTVVELSYYDTSRQFQPSMVPARTEAPSSSVNVQRISTFWVMTAEAAARRSAIALMKADQEFQEFNHYLPPIIPYVAARPIDVVAFDEEGVGVRTKIKSWGLDTDWGVRHEYQYLFRTAADLAIPMELEPVEPSLPQYEMIGEVDFSKRGNSGLVAVFSGQ